MAAWCTSLGAGAVGANNTGTFTYNASAAPNSCALLFVNQAYTFTEGWTACAARITDNATSTNWCEISYLKLIVRFAKFLCDQKNPAKSSILACLTTNLARSASVLDRKLFGRTMVDRPDGTNVSKCTRILFQTLGAQAIQIGAMAPVSGNAQSSNCVNQSLCCDDGQALPCAIGHNPDCWQQHNATTDNCGFSWTSTYAGPLAPSPYAQSISYTASGGYNLSANKFCMILGQQSTSWQYINDK
jgi:hypothetical protein